MKIIEKIFSEYKKQLKENEFRSKFVKLFYCIVNYLQTLTTISGHIRIWMYSFNSQATVNMVKGFVTFWVISTFSVLVLLNIINIGGKFILFFSCFRLWEIFIINFWMFLFRQSATSVHTNSKPDIEGKENDIRLLLLLFVQYFTVVICFAGIFRYWFLNRQVFFPVQIKTFDFMDSIYFSLVTITTLGYGDISPLTTLGKGLVLIELSFGLFFILLFLTTILSKIKFNWKNGNLKKP